jgi:hypothetical protein
MSVTDEDLGPYDRVKTPAGPGTLIGFTKEKNLCAVMLDTSFLTNSLCDLFDKTDIALTGKMRNSEYNREIDGVSCRIDPLAFQGTRFTICDRVKVGPCKGYVCGIADSMIRIQMDDGSVKMMEMEDGAVDIIMRYALIPLMEEIWIKDAVVGYSKSILDFSGCWMKAGDWFMRGDKVVMCMGITEEGSFVMMDEAVRVVELMGIEDVPLAVLQRDTF